MEKQKIFILESREDDTRVDCSPIYADIKLYKVVDFIKRNKDFGSTSGKWYWAVIEMYIGDEDYIEMHYYDINGKKYENQGDLIDVYKIIEDE